MDMFLQWLLSLVIVAGIAHWLWERAHVGLYTGYAHLTRLPITVDAALGDVGYTIGTVLLVSFIKANIAWVLSPSSADLLALAVLGCIIALMVEYKALAFKHWAYRDTMPILPFLHVGLTPIVQMTVLLPATVWIAGAIARGIF